MASEDEFTGHLFGGIMVVAGIFILILLIISLFSTFYIIPAGYRGVLLTFGKADTNIIGEGLHMKVPLVQDIIKIEIRTQKYEADASAASKDLQIVSSHIATNFHLLPEQIVNIYNTVGLDFANRIIQPMEQEVVKATTAKFTAEELITKREEVRTEIKQLFKERMSERGIVVEEVSITNFDFSKSFNEAIEAKVTAEQNALAAKNKLEQIKFEAQQAIEAAKGKAEALQIEGDALKSNPQIATLRAIEKWNGISPMVTSGAIIPFVDVTTLGK